MTIDDEQNDGLGAIGWLLYFAAATLMGVLGFGAGCIAGYIVRVLS